MKAIVLNNELPALSRNNIIYQFNRVHDLAVLSIGNV